MELLEFHLFCTTVAVVSMELAGSIRKLYRRRKGKKSTPSPQEGHMIDNSISPICLPTSESEVKCIKKDHYTLSDFDLVQVLGEGSFGKVFLAKETGNKEYYAVKSMKKKEVIQHNNVEATHIEKRVLSLGSSCPFLAHLHSTFSGPGHLFYVMEYLSGGSLSHHLRISQNFELDRARFYAAEIVAGIQYLHRNGIIHRDLKPANILLDKDGHCRLADFGACCENMIPGVTTKNSRCGTRYYMAPEVVACQDYSFEIDWWSFGVVCFEMISGEVPFKGHNRQQVFKAILWGYVDFPKTINGHVINFISNLLNYKPWERLGCIEDMCPIRNHPFFQDIDWDKLERKELEPPYKPLVQSDDDTSNFDTYYTHETARLSTDSDFGEPITQEYFGGFTFTSP